MQEKECEPLVKKLFEVADAQPLGGRPLKTNISDFDSAMEGGVRDGEMITISGPSGHGKTAFALYLAKQFSDSGVPVQYFSYEQSYRQIREILVRMGVTENFPIFAPTSRDGNSPEWIEERITYGMEHHACKVIFLDNLHYLLPEDQDRNSSLLIGSVARRLKQLALNTGTTIFLLAHMRKPNDGEAVNRNMVRDSALIINESDYTFLIERLKKKKPKFGNLLENNDTNYAKITLDKNRYNGNTPHRFFELDDTKTFRQLTPEEVAVLGDKIQQ